MPRAQPDPALDIANLARMQRRDFYLLPTYWRRFRYRRRLAWHTVRFRKNHRPHVPDAPGVYAFLVIPTVVNGPEARYLFYIGKTDSLHRRFGDYLRESRSPGGRAKLRDMFRAFRGHVHFSFALAPLNHIDNLETELIATYWPPANSIYGEISEPRRVLS